MVEAGGGGGVGLVRLVGPVGLGLVPTGLQLS